MPPLLRHICTKMLPTLCGLKHHSAGVCYLWCYGWRPVVFAPI